MLYKMTWSISLELSQYKYVSIVNSDIDGAISWIWVKSGSIYYSNMITDKSIMPRSLCRCKRGAIINGMFTRINNDI